MKITALPILSFLICLICLICLTGPIALAQNSGGIVFATTAIDPASPTGLTDQFEAGDNIHAVAFLDKNLLGIVGKDSATKVGVEIFLYELKPPLYDYQQPSEVQLVTSTLTITGGYIERVGDHHVIPIHCSRSSAGRLPGADHGRRPRWARCDRGEALRRRRTAVSGGPAAAPG